MGNQSAFEVVFRNDQIVNTLSMDLEEEKLLTSSLDNLPDNVEKLCEDLGITVDYYIEEFM